MQAKCQKTIAEAVKKLNKPKLKIQVHQIQAVAPEILWKKTKPTALKVTISISTQGEEERRVSKQPSPDTIELDSPASLEPEGPEPSGTQIRSGDDSDHPLIIEDTKEMETMETKYIEPAAESTTATPMDTETVAEPQPSK